MSNRCFLSFFTSRRVFTWTFSCTDPVPHPFSQPRYNRWLFALSRLLARDLEVSKPLASTSLATRSPCCVSFVSASPLARVPTCRNPLQSSAFATSRQRVVLAPHRRDRPACPKGSPHRLEYAKQASRQSVDLPACPLTRLPRSALANTSSRVEAGGLEVFVSPLPSSAGSSAGH